MQFFPPGKKGGIPAVNEIVTFVTGILPDPIKILLFILIIGLLASFVIPLILGLFGYACVNEFGTDTLYIVPMDSFVQKTFNDLYSTVNNYINPKDYQVPEDPFPDGDKHYLRVAQECLREVTYNDTLVTGYIADCIDCPVSDTSFFPQRSRSICIGDGVTNVWNVWNRNLCSICTPPSEYYYNHSNAVALLPVYNDYFFTIVNESQISNINENFEDLTYLQRVLQLGGVKQSISQDEFVNVQCADVGQPDLYVFNIRVFDARLWIFITIAGALIGFAFKWYSVTL